MPPAAADAPEVPPGRAASGGALAPESPRATRSQPESILIVLNSFCRQFFFFRLNTRLNLKKNKKKQNSRQSVWTLADCEWHAAAPGLKPFRLPRAPK